MRTRHYLITTKDGRVFLAPNVEGVIEALALPYMPHACDVSTINEWVGKDMWSTLYPTDASDDEVWV